MYLKRMRDRFGSHCHLFLIERKREGPSLVLTKRRPAAPDDCALLAFSRKVHSPLVASTIESFASYINTMLSIKH
jgi:hypothetical protein